MNIFYIITSVAFFIWIVRNTLFWVNLWQTKEYRLDRLLAHFRETNKGSSIFFSIPLLAKWTIIFAFAFTITDEKWLFVYHIVVGLVFLYEAFTALHEIISHRFRRPAATGKALGIIFVTLFLMVFLYTVTLVEPFLYLMLLDRMLPLIIAIIIAFLAYPTEFVQGIIIERARKKIAKHKNLLVIGISGSVGKSSTKEYIAQVLSQKFTVLKTEGSHNTPMGIAQTVLKGLTDKTQVFVVELGSYKKGEVAELCDIVKPQISVTTSISDQHLSLFGSFKNIFATEEELIDSLPKKGLALFNGNNENTFLLYKKAGVNKVLYITQDASKELRKKYKENKKIKTIKADGISVEKTSVSFTVLLNGAPVAFSASLLGRHNVENILPAIYLANHLGMTAADIKKAVAKLKGLEKRMIAHKMKNGALIIDDSFNASPESVEAALSYMRLYKGKKVLLLEPMIELGKNAKTRHYDMGREIAGECDYLFLTNDNFYKQILQGVLDAQQKCVVAVKNPHEIAEFILKNLGREDVVVCEGKETGMTMRKIL